MKMKGSWTSQILNQLNEESRMSDPWEEESKLKREISSEKQQVLSGKAKTPNLLDFYLLIFLILFN